MSLTYQDKLALALTSAGSQRRLAALVGASHQQIGRWLREGQPATIDPETGYTIHQKGAKAIPPAFHAAINNAFSIHREITRDQARADGIPYAANAPVFIYRGMLRSGAKGDRVIADNTQYIRPEIRTEFLTTMHQSRRFYSASVRSTVNFRRYTDRRAAEEINRTGRRISVKKLSGYMLEAFLHETNKILPIDETLPLYTRYEGFQPGTNAFHAVDAVNAMLKQKHETSAIDLADEYLLQLIPQGYVKPQTGQKTSKAATRASLKRK